MAAFVEIAQVGRTFRLPGGDWYIALSNINLEIQRGEFVCLVGHSGCGKSTLLNIVAGLDRPSEGVVILQGQEVRKPGPDRMVVFQNYSLLPWLTVQGNIELAVHQVLGHLPPQEQRDIVQHHIQLVGLSHAADKKPSRLSGGMKQRVAIARALAIRPQLLLLDEPFGALDALTRGGLQEELMKICEESQVTCLMVTHDVDEALLLSDRIVLMTNGPQAHVGQVVAVPFPRPRNHLDVVKDPRYYGLRSEVVNFLNQQKHLQRRQGRSVTEISRHGLEKVNLDLGFIPLVDFAPLVVAQERGFFQKQGLDQITFSREPSWKLLAEGITSGRLDAAPMIGGLPLALTLGMNQAPPVPIVSALTLSRDGNAILFSRRIYDQGIHSLADYKTWIAQRDHRCNLGVVHPASVQNALLRYWLATAGIDPDRDVQLVVIPPANMISNLQAGTIDVCCAANPWASQAVYEGVGVTVATSHDICPGLVDKVLGVREDWAQQHPKTHLALIKALWEAGRYCEQPEHRQEVLELLCRADYVGTDPVYTRYGLTEPYRLGTDAVFEGAFIHFDQHQNGAPDRVQGLWLLAEMARWGVVPFPPHWEAVLDRVYRRDLHHQALTELGEIPPGDGAPPPPTLQFLDGTVFHGTDPLAYLQNLAIHRGPLSPSSTPRD